MWVYSNIWGLRNNITAQWKNGNAILDLDMQYVLMNYVSIYIEFIDNETNQIAYYNLYNTPISILTEYASILSFLTNANGYITDGTLETNVNFNYYTLVKYYNLFKANFTVKLPKTTTDLVIKNDLYPISADFIRNYYLITINGYVHNYYTNTEVTTDHYGNIQVNNSINILNGQETFKKLIRSQLGALDFSSIGSLVQTPFCSTDFINSSNYFLDIQLPLPVDYSSDSQSLMLVIGGYIHYLNQGFTIDYDNNIININLSQTMFLERYIESSLYFNLDSTYLDETIWYNGFYSYSDYNSEDITSVSDLVIQTYIDNTPCSIVVVNNPNLGINNYFINNSDFPGTFITNEEPLYPLMTSSGRLIEYTYEEHLRGYKLTILDEVLKHVVIRKFDSNITNSFYRGWYNGQYTNPPLFVTGSFLKLYVQDQE